MRDPSDLVPFYEPAYSYQGDQAALYSRWRTLGAVGKADHVVALGGRGRISPPPRSTWAAGMGPCSQSYDVGVSAGACAAWRSRRPPSKSRAEGLSWDSVTLYDGERLPFPLHR